MQAKAYSETRLTRSIELLSLAASVLAFLRGRSLQRLQNPNGPAWKIAAGVLAQLPIAFERDIINNRSYAAHKGKISHLDPNSDLYALEHNGLEKAKSVNQANIWAEFVRAIFASSGAYALGVGLKGPAKWLGFGAMGMFWVSLEKRVGAAKAKMEENGIQPKPDWLDRMPSNWTLPAYGVVAATYFNAAKLFPALPSAYIVGGAFAAQQAILLPMFNARWNLFSQSAAAGKEESTSAKANVVSNGLRGIFAALSIPVAGVVLSLRGEQPWPIARKAALGIRALNAVEMPARAANELMDTMAVEQGRPVGLQEALTDFLGHPSWLARVTTRQQAEHTGPQR